MRAIWVNSLVPPKHHLELAKDPVLGWGIDPSIQKIGHYSTTLNGKYMEFLVSTKETEVPQALEAWYGEFSLDPVLNTKTLGTMTIEDSVYRVEQSYLQGVTVVWFVWVGNKGGHPNE